MITARRFALVLLVAVFAFGGFAVIEGCGGGKQAEQTQTTTQEGTTMTQKPDTTGMPGSMGTQSMGSQSTGSGSMGSGSMGSHSMGADTMGHKSMAPEMGESMYPEQHKEAMTLAGYVCPMHPEETSLEPGTCGVCGMALEPAKLHYVCPMHPEEVSLEPGKCSICGMDLVLRPVD